MSVAEMVDAGHQAFDEVGGIGVSRAHQESGVKVVRRTGVDEFDWDIHRSKVQSMMLCLHES